MPVIVPRDFNFPSRTGIASRKPVRGVQLARIGHALNYLRGHGHVVIPATRLSAVAIPAGSAYVYDFIGILKPQTRHLVWNVVPRVDTGMAVGTFTMTGGQAHTFSALASDPARRPLTTGVRFIDALGATSPINYFGAAFTVTIENDASSTADLYIDSIGCYALPRETLEIDADDVGINVPTIGPELPIFDADDHLSIGALSRAMENQEDTGLIDMTARNLFSWARPRGYGIEFNGTTWTPVFVEGPVVQAHHRFRDEVLRGVYCNVVGYVATPGDSLEVRFTAASGDAITETDASTASGSWGFPTLLDVDAEDLSTSDGRRDATDEVITIEARVTGSGTQQGWLEGLSIIDSKA